MENHETRREFDYDDQLYIPVIFRLPLQTYDWVLLDEAQDTSPARRVIALRCLNPPSDLSTGGRMVAVGDDHQAIYGASLSRV